MKRFCSVDSAGFDVKKGGVVHFRLKYRDSLRPSKRSSCLELDFKIINSKNSFVLISDLVEDLDNVIIGKITSLQTRNIFWDHVIILSNYRSEGEQRHFIPLLSIAGEVDCKDSDPNNLLTRVELFVSSNQRNYQVSIKGVADYYTNKRYIFEEDLKFEEADRILRDLTGLFDKNISFERSGLILRYVKINKDLELKVPVLARIK